MDAVLAAFFFALLVTTIWFRVRYYRSLIHYDPTRDQAYDFSETDANIFEIQIGENTFQWPEDAGTCDTAFLEVKFRATIIGWWCDPSVEVRCGLSVVRQYFERGGGGQRYVNASALISEIQAGAKLQLSGSGLRILPGKARLICFRNSRPVKPRVLAVSPHPDDAEIAAFRLYSSCDSWVATATTGEHGGFLIKAFAGNDDLQRTTAELRVWDSITVPQLGGVGPERSINLCYNDTALTELFAHPDQPVPSDALSTVTRHTLRRTNLTPLLRPKEDAFTWKSLVEDFRRLLEEIRPEIIATPHPLLDDHPDHALTTVAICEALAALPELTGNLHLYVTHSRWSAILPVGETDGAVSLPPHFGQPTFFRSICSLPLTRTEQLRKYLAIEAMHDLRNIPGIRDESFPQAVRTILATARGIVTGLRRDPRSFQRRAVRPNELFFVVPFSEAGRLRQQWLEERQP